MTYRMVVDSIVRETSLSAGDVSNAIISLAAVMRDALHMGMGVDLGELGSFRLVVPPRMMDSEEEVTVESLKKPRIVYTPRKDMRDAAGEVELHVAKKKRIGQRTPAPQGRTGRPPIPGRHSCRRTMNAGGTGDCEKK